MTHKLTTYILKCNKVEKDAKKKLTKDKDGKEGKKEKKEKKDKDVEETDEERAARKAKKAAKKAKKAAEEADDEEEEDDDDEDDEAKEKRKKAEKKEKKRVERAAEFGDDGAEEDEDSSALKSAINGLREYMSKHASSNDVISEVRAVQTFCALPRSERGFILVAAAFPQGPLAKGALAGKQAVLRDFAKESGVETLFGGLEKYCAVAEADLAPKFALVLKTLYDLEIVKEDELLAWHAAGVGAEDHEVHYSSDCGPEKRAQLLAFAEPFITWLKEAEEEEEDDDEGDTE